MQVPTCCCVGVVWLAVGQGLPLARVEPQPAVEPAEGQSAGRQPNAAKPLPQNPVKPTEKTRAALSRSADIEAIMPRWNLGDGWTVETVARPLQARRGGTRATITRPIQWQFAVSRFEKSLTHDCFRIEVRCQAAPQQQPDTVLWIDRESLALRQITAHLPVPGDYRAMTVRYDFDSGQPAPVLGPLTALPIDTPVFLAGQAKGLAAFSYQSFHGPPESKALGDVGFIHQIEQRITTLSPDEVDRLLNERFSESLLDGEFTKSLPTQPVTDVRLKSHGREVRQLWQPGRPWPIYCDNGYTVCRLVGFSSTEVERSP